MLLLLLPTVAKPTARTVGYSLKLGILLIYGKRVDSNRQPAHYELDLESSLQLIGVHNPPEQADFALGVPR